MFASGLLKEAEEYDVDFDHQFIETEKYDAKPTYFRMFFHILLFFGWLLRSSPYWFKEKCGILP